MTEELLSHSTQDMKRAPVVGELKTIRKQSTCDLQRRLADWLNLREYQ